MSDKQKPGKVAAGEPHDYWPDYKTAVEDNVALRSQLEKAQRDQHNLNTGQGDFDFVERTNYRINTLKRQVNETRERAETAKRDLATAQARIAGLTEALEAISLFTVMNSRDAGYVINATAIDEALAALLEPPSGGTK